MLYPKNQTERPDPQLFREPSAEYRAVPFWAWNCELDTKILEKEIDCMKEMGFGGFMIHSRVGLATPYLSEEFMACVRACVEKGRANGMYTWLYDEDRWPSGSAGGLNTKKLKNRQKALFVTGAPYDDGTLVTERDKANAIKEIPNAPYFLVACYDICLDSDGRLVSYRRIRLEDEVPEGHDKWFAYLRYGSTGAFYNNQAYCDTLRKDVVRDFIRITHEAYRKDFGEEFGTLIPAIFTDEPTFRFAKKELAFPTDRSGIYLPYTTDFAETFARAWHYSIEDHIPAVVWEPADRRLLQIRYQYRDHLAERFAEAFMDTIGEWCRENNLYMAGHLLNEQGLASQALCAGDLMRSYRGFTLPGIDLLCDQREFTTAKQAQSAAHQGGLTGVACELYGVTDWQFDFRGHKLQGDWLAALGVTCRIPHLFWVSMGGEAKRDYPASIGCQSPWYREYKHIEDHFARVNTIMTRGTPVVDIGVIHPCESIWLHFGPQSQTQNARETLERHFAELIEWMLRGLLDFDYISESRLPEQYQEDGDGFAVGKMSYQTILVPSLETIRSTTLQALKKFRAAGGEVIFVGEIPKYVDAVLSGEAEEFAAGGRVIPWDRGALYEALSRRRQLEIRTPGGRLSRNLIYQLRRDGAYRHLFLSHVDKPDNCDTAPLETYSVRLFGDWTVTELDTMTGETRRLQVSYRNAGTEFPWVCGSHDSLLLELAPGRDTGEGGFVYAETRYAAAETPAHLAAYELDEPNVLLLDSPEFCFNGGGWQPPLNILKLDEKLRRELGLRSRGPGNVQPWAQPPDKHPKDRLSLRFSFDSAIEAEGTHLGLECAAYTERIRLNGIEVPVRTDGYYVDEASIATVLLPRLRKGRNELVLDMKFGDAVPLEACYLLGAFGVEHHGVFSRVTALPDVLYFDDITSQGLPFYGGNIRYRMKFTGGGKKTLEISRYLGAVIKVFVDGEDKGYVDFPPHRRYLGELADGVHTLELLLFGNRANTFGHMHSTDTENAWAVNWRTDGRFWTDEYLLRPAGIFTAPRILTEE